MQVKINKKQLKSIQDNIKKIDNISANDLLEAIGLQVEQEIRENFESEKDSWGNKWKNQNSPTYNHLNITNNMQGSLNTKATNKEVTIGFNAVSINGYNYPAVHQFGSKKKNIPARPFMPIDTNGNLEPQLSKRINESIYDLFR